MEKKISGSFGPYASRNATIGSGTPAESLDMKPEFYVQSIANRRDLILVVESYTHIYTYARSWCSKL